MKTVAVGIVLCLNLGVDPPDAVKPAGTTLRMAGVEIAVADPALSSQKALEVIAKALQAQYECWQPRARYKLCLDPTLEDVKKVRGAARPTRPPPPADGSPGAPGLRRAAPEP